VSLACTSKKKLARNVFRLGIIRSKEKLVGGKRKKQVLSYIEFVESDRGEL
jgi:hypothetical protein